MALTKVTGSVIKDSVSLSGNVSVGGTLTYQDVTNVDALGVGTFRTGINVSGGQLDVGSNVKIGNAGIVTASNFKTGVTNLHSTGLTLTGGQLDVGSNIKVGTAGVVTATSFVGSGANLTSLPAANLTGTLPAISGANLTSLSAANLTGTLPAISGANLTGITGTTINTNADNRIITGSGTANTLNGEANLTFDGTNLKIGNAGTDGVLRIRGAANSTQVSISDNTSATLRIKTASGALGQIFVESGQNLVLGTDNTERLRIDSSGSIMTTGNVNIGRSSNAGEALTVRGPADGDAIRLERAGSYQWFMGQDSGSNLYFKANTTKEITFPAAGGIAFNGETASNNTLNDYEEGSFTPQFEGLSNTPAYAVRNGKYTKVGRLVHITGIMQAGGTNPTFTTTSDILKITGLPYAGTGVMYYVSLGNVSHQGWNCMGSGNNEQNYSSGNIDFMNCQMEHNTSKMLFIAGASGSSRSRIRNASVHNQGFIMMFELSYTAA